MEELNKVFARKSVDRFGKDAMTKTVDVSGAGCWNKIWGEWRKGQVSAERGRSCDRIEIENGLKYRSFTLQGDQRQ